MKFRGLLAGAALAALVGGTLGFSSVQPATADASSSLHCWYPGEFGYGKGYQHRARTVNSGTLYRGGHLDLYSKGWACNGAATDVEHIGAAAYLKKTTGAACSTASVTYVYASTLTRNAPVVSACGTGSLQGTGTSYGYNIYGTGYASASIAAPFQIF